MKARLSSVMAGCCVFASFVLMRAAYIQVKGDPRLETMARRQFQSKVLIRPKRGVIFDRNGEALAINTEVKSLAANPSKIQNKKTLARLLAKALDIPLAKLQIKLKEHREFIWIKRHMSESDMNRLKKFRVVESDGDLMDGLWLVKEDQRFYPHGELSSHILGSVNLDSEGLEGVELWANDKMRGKVVSFSAIKDALGRPTFIDAVAAQHLKDGEPVQLTVDAALQYSVEQELHNAVAKANAKGGSVMVMNSVTGEILAMANEPSFNPNRKDASPDRRRN